MAHILYGDGEHDDTPAIQELLDAGPGHILLPVPKVRYQISRTLKIHSGQALELPAFTEIRLMPGSSCQMLTNALDHGSRSDRDIALIGGIWNADNLNQEMNPLHNPEKPYSGDGYVRGTYPTCYRQQDFIGETIRLQHIENLNVRGLTLRNPTTFGIMICYAKYFSVSDIFFDYTTANPFYLNMDGVHLDGGCSYGEIRNLRGVCYDDLVALNADDIACGPLSHIHVDGIYSEDCHSAVRLLSVESRVDDIEISNVHGTFYAYGIGITKYHKINEKRGNYGTIVLRDIFCAGGKPVSGYWNPAGCPCIYFQGETDVESLSVYEFHREEVNKEHLPSILVEPAVHVRNLRIDGYSHRSQSGKELVFLENNGQIDDLEVEHVTSPDRLTLTGTGRIGRKSGPFEMK